MSRRTLILLILMCVATLAANNISPGVLIFKTQSPLTQIRNDRTGLTAFDTYLDRLSASNMRLIPGMPGERYFLVDVANEPDWQAVKSGSMKFDGIEYVQPNYYSTMHIEPNDPLYPLQFHYVTSTPQAWNYTTGSPVVIVGVVDSGILREHPDLMANLYINPHEIPDNGIDDDNNGYIDDWCGWDFADAPELSDIAIGDYRDRDNDVTDENFHGTHVAGIIGAVGNNGIGIAGVAWNVKLLPVRAGFRTTQGAGYLQDDDAAAAIIYAADMGCHVINMSWGDPNYSPIIGDACQYAYDKGVTLIASAGNDPGPYLSYPSKLSTVISVGAVNKNRNIAGFSSYGVDMDLVAPGEAVLSTYKLDAGELYFEQSGTSMSSPYVAGAAALLLSLHPGLHPDEVRARLCTSTDDLGPVGFDPQYGHGLLNIRKLMESVSPPLINIERPFEQIGVNGSFDIIGTVQANDFFRFCVMYTSKEVPSILDWMDVNTHTNLPSYFTAPVQNGLLAHFYIPELFPEGQYLIRVQYEDRSGRKYNYYRTVNYDDTPPQLVTQSLQGIRRYNQQNVRYYAAMKFDEKVRTELKIIAADTSIHFTYGTLLDSLHVLALPASLPPGPVDISVRATNVANLTYDSPLFTGFLNIDYELVPNHGFVYEQIGNARVPLTKMYDYNGDGAPEYLAMTLPTSGYGNVYAYQPEAAGHTIKHDFSGSYWLLDSGNTFGPGQEMLVLNGDQAVLYETAGGSLYPNEAIWQDTAITGGALADYTGDGVDDILVVKNLPAERVIQAYRRTGANTITPKNVLRNTTTTYLRNNFVSTIIVKNFDNDSYRDILTADTDGDIMMFEIMNDNMHERVWHTRLPVGNTYTLTSGDYDGNGRQDFFVGGYYTDVLNPDLNFWYFEGFRNVSNNNYTSMGSIMFNDVKSQNSVQSFDLDNDGKDEIILAISPNLYVLKYTNGQFKPVFHGNSFRTYQTLAWRDANNRAYFTTNYAVTPDSIVAVQWTSDDPFTGPPTPANLQTTPLDANRVRVSWIGNGASAYRVYRKENDGAPEMIAEIAGTSYLDTGLRAGTVYQYSVTCINTAYTPSESMPAIWQSVTPDDPPLLESITLVGPSELRLIFDRQLANSAVNPGLFSVSHNIGNPLSVNNIMGQNGLLMRFREPFADIAEAYTLSIRNVTGVTGVAPLESEYQFHYVPDTQPPMIVSARVLENKSSVELLLSESISASNPNPTHLLNYRLFNPPHDPDNSITSATLQDNRIILDFAGNLKYGSQAYLLVVENIADLAGNVISAQHNIARIALADISDLKNVTVYPNPVKAAKDTWCAFINFPHNKKGRIKIFNSSADLVFSGDVGPFHPQLNSTSWRWYLTNNDGRKVSSGIYYYVIEMDGEIARGKIAIIR